MIHTAVGDVLEPGYTHIIHQCNCFCTMGSGLALQIKNKYKSAFIADGKTKKGDLSKLGTFSYGFEDGRIIYNLYSQAGYGSTDRQTSYDAMDKGLRRIARNLQIQYGDGLAVRVAIPYKLGCGLGNGDWKIVSAIIDSVFMDEEYSVTICRRKGD